MNPDHPSALQPAPQLAPCIVNPDGVSSSTAPGQLQGGSSGGDGYSQKFFGISLGLLRFCSIFFAWDFVVGCTEWLGFLLIFFGWWICWVLLFGFVEVLFKFFCLGFRCWMHRVIGVFVNFFWVMDLLLELSMCVWFKLIYFAIGTLSVFMGFVALWYCFFPCIVIPLCLMDHWDNRGWIILSYMYLYLQSILKSIFIAKEW